HLHAHDSAAVGIGSQLHIYRGVEASVGHLHPPASGSVVLTRGSRFRTFSPCLPLPAFCSASACFCLSSGNWDTACSMRASFSSAAFFRAPFCLALNCAVTPSSTC